MSDFPESLQKFAIPPASKNTAGRKDIKVKNKSTDEVSGDIKQKIASELNMMAAQGIISVGNKSPYKDEYQQEGVENNDTTVAVNEEEVNVKNNEELHDISDENGADFDPFVGKNVEQVKPANNSKVVTKVIEKESAVDKYLKGFKRVSFEIADGTFSIAVTDVIESKLSVMILLPLNPGATVFVPKPGTQLTISFDGKNIKTYFPGTYVEVMELKTGFMSLIKADVEEQFYDRKT